MPLPAVREGVAKAGDTEVHYYDSWGEVPVAVVTLREGTSPSEIEIIEFVRSRAAHFKAPKVVYFAELPKTSTGKVQKNLLRDWVRDRSHDA